VSPACPLRLRQRELFAGPWAAPWFGTVHPCLGRTLYERSTPSDRCAIIGLIRRGFVAEVRCTMAAFVGGVCGRCEGTGRIEKPPRLRRGHSTQGMMMDCPACSGTGRTPGLAAVLFTAQPVTGVWLTDREPYNRATATNPRGESRGLEGWS